MVAPAVELLRFPVEAHRATVTLASLTTAARRARVRLTTTRTYRGDSPWLMLWGPGGLDRVEPMRQQLAQGGHVIALDLAYWQRDRKFRVSIDAAHPQAWVMRRAWPSSRFHADGVRLERTWRPDGPVLIAGIGDKALAQYGDGVRAWELEMIRAAHASGRTVYYRPKRAGGYVPDGIPSAAAGSIDDVVRGASRVITWHSNVAVDAIRLGVPVICRDGAAAAICPSVWTDDQAPLPEELRAAFMANLAWYQWDTRESLACWAWLPEVLACAS